MKIGNQMKTFLKYMVEQTAMKASGLSAARHTKQYITPYLPGGSKHAAGSHEMAVEHGPLKAGEKVTVVGHEIKQSPSGKDVHHAIVQAHGSDHSHTIPTSKLLKPASSARRNKGLEQEGQLAQHLNKHGLMRGSGAGFTGDNDFHLIDKRGVKEKRIGGTEGAKGAIQGEHKSDIKSTAFGQITLSRHPETGQWHIDDKARAKRPEYAQHVENANVTVNGKTKSLLQHLNDTEPPGTSNKGGFYSDHTSASPAHAYMRDHGVDVAHIDTHGTYRAGTSEHKDVHKLGLPVMHGEGRFRTRQKTDNPDKRTVQFSLTKLDKSHTNIGTDEGAQKLKNTLGH
jgi:hypothetical protein